MGIGASILLMAIGAILTFAVAIDQTPFAGVIIEWTTVGVILMIVGAIGLAWSLMTLNAWRDRNRDRDRDRYDDRTVVEEERVIHRR